MKLSISAVAMLATYATAFSLFDTHSEGSADYRGARTAIVNQRRDLEARANTNKKASGGTQSNAQAASTCLDAAAVQTGSASTGQVGAGDPGQSSSLTDPANFINFCKGQTLTNGLQIKGGSCNGIVMGKIPATTSMISSILISPKPGQDLPASTTFTISVQMVGLAAGSFTNPQLTYYSAPQNLDGSGKIIGHTHVTVQDLGKSLTPSTPPDPTTFVFFKGINDAGNNNGLLSASVAGGLPAGNYRVCTMASSSNHQPVLMPVAQRGAQDDCTKFTVGGGAGGGSSSGSTGSNTGAVTGSNGGAKAKAGSGGAKAKAGAGANTADAAAAASTDAAATAGSDNAGVATAAASSSATEAPAATNAAAPEATSSSRTRGSGRHRTRTANAAKAATAAGAQPTNAAAANGVVAASATQAAATSSSSRGGRQRGSRFYGLW